MKHSVLAALVMLVLTTGCYDRSKNEVQGYVEGDFVRVSLPNSGIVENVHVKKGQKVQKGTLLFTLDSAREQASLEKSLYELEIAKAELANLKASERTANIEALESELYELKANLAYTAAAYNRRIKLSKIGASAIDEADKFKSEELAVRAKIKAAESRLLLARQSIGRDDEIGAAVERLKAREAAVQEAKAKLDLRTATAPAEATVSDVIYRPGETVSNGQAVIELLPPENIKVRFYLSPEQVGRVQTTPELFLQCASCGEQGLEASVSYIAPEASYRPPILYSRDQSEKLVFLTEAVPLGMQTLLRPGQPVTVVFKQ